MAINRQELMTVADKKNTKNTSLARRGTKGSPKTSRTASQRRVVSALPKSKARTAYGLLSEVCALIAEEPKRYNQGLYIAYRDSDFLIPSCDTPRGFASCGTVACVAGWVATLKYEGTLAYETVDNLAADILGLDPDQRHELFGGGAIDGSPQTEEYAKAGIAHIRAFQNAYAAQLKAKSVIA